MSSKKKQSFIENTLDAQIIADMGVATTDPEAMITAIKKQLGEDLQTRRLRLLKSYCFLVVCRPEDVAQLIRCRCCLARQQSWNGVT